MKVTLDRLLHSQGFGSRRACRELVWSGSVFVDDEPIVKPHAEVETEGFSWMVDGVTWHYQEQVYLALHKPAGSECSRKPTHHASVLELLPEPYITRGVQPVGRLDQDSTGLLLLSDDGAFIHAHSSPKRHVAKTYIATIADAVSEAMIEALLTGVQLHAEPKPLAARSCRRVDEHSLEIVLEQGKYHQVKRMLAAAGTRCTALHRSAIGGLQLETLGLAPGEYRELDETLRARLLESPPGP